MAVFKNCKNCGAEFKVSKDRRFYCCNECKFQQRRYASVRKKQKTVSNLLSIQNINRKAIEADMTYGEYVSKFGL